MPWMRASTSWGARPAAIAHAGSGAEGPRRGEPLGMTEVGGADGDVEPAAGAADRGVGGGEFVDGLAGVPAGAREDVVDVGLRVVVAEDRLAEVAVGAAQ